MSLQDRIQSLQNASKDKDNNLPSVASRTAAVERATQSGTTVRSQLSTLTKQFENPSQETSSITSQRLGAHIAKFDSSSDSLSQRVKKLESTTENVSNTGSVAGRTAVFERAESDSTNSNMDKTKFLFEKDDSKGSQQITQQIKKLSISEDQDVNEEESKITNRWQQREIESKEENVKEKTSSVAKTNSSVTNIWAARERGEEVETKSIEEKSKSTNEVNWTKQKEESSETPKEIKQESNIKVKQKTLAEEVGDLRKENELLISTLFELTNSFKKLEDSRQMMQKRISELENK